MRRTAVLANSQCRAPSTDKNIRDAFLSPHPVSRPDIDRTPAFRRAPQNRHVGLNLRSDIRPNFTMRMPEIVGQFAHIQIDDVIVTWSSVQTGGCAHPKGNCVVRTGRITTYAQSADDLAALIESDTASKRNYASWNLAHSCALRLKCRVERVGVVETVEGASRVHNGARRVGIGRLSEGGQVGGRERQ